MNDREPKVLLIRQPVIVKELAAQLEMRMPQIMKELMDRGMFAGINTEVPRPIAESILKAHGARYSFVAD